MKSDDPEFIDQTCADATPSLETRCAALLKERAAFERHAAARKAVRDGMSASEAADLYDANLEAVDEYGAKRTAGDQVAIDQEAYDAYLQRLRDEIQAVKDAQ